MCGTRLLPAPRPAELSISPQTMAAGEGGLGLILQHSVDTEEVYTCIYCIYTSDDTQCNYTAIYMYIVLAE